MHSYDVQECLYQNCEIYGPRVRGSSVRVGLNKYIVKMHYFFENLFLCSWVSNKLTKCIVMMSKSASTKIVNFMAPGSGVLV